ncbi:MAG: translation initiation factor IF-2 [Christensenellales bacterium]|jgi:translation initiation factor IF-2
MGEDVKRKGDILENIKKLNESRNKINMLLNYLKKPFSEYEELVAALSQRKAVLLEELRIRKEQELLTRQREEEIRRAKESLLQQEEQKKEEKPAEAKDKQEEKPAAEEKVEKEAPRVSEPEKIINKPISEVKAAKEEQQAAKKAEPKTEAVKPKTEAQEKPQYEVKVSKLWRQPSYDRRPPKSAGQSPRPQTSAPMDKGTRPKMPGAKPAFRDKAPTPIIIEAPVITKEHKKKSPDKSAKSDNALAPKKVMSRKTLERKGFVTTSSSAIEYDDSGEIRKIRTRKISSDKKKSDAPKYSQVDHVVLTTDTLTIRSFSEKIGKPGAEIVKQLFNLGIFKTLNDNIDFETAELVANELGVTLELQAIKTGEEKLIESHIEDEDTDSAELVTRPPIVTIMGHVDHGKTSLLDYIRKTNVAGGEAGGITQHIGAYSIKLNGRQITFMDTPGHAAFAAMRARGADVTDIVIIIVAADDGIMPQTVEAISHAKAAKVPIIIAVNKIDKEDANPDRVLQQLTEYELVPEAWGGDIPVVNVSAKTGQGVEELLETIFITADLAELKANPNRSASGVIIEAKLDKGKGPVATILVKNGTLKQGDNIVAGTTAGKIRAMTDDKGRSIKEAGPSMAVSVLGLQAVPNAGDSIMAVEDDKLSKQVVEERKTKEKIAKLQYSKVSLDDVFRKIEEGKFKNLNLIIKADVQGSVEALKNSFVELSGEEVKVAVVYGGVGAISETDVMLAMTSESIIIGFNVRPDTNAKNMAEKNGVDIRYYRVIYDAIDDVRNAIKGLLAPKFSEVHIGKAEVREVFKLSSAGTIAGCMVKEGKMERGASLRLLRDNIVIFEGKFGSLKRFKDDVKEVQTGFECGIGIENYNNIQVGDVIEAYKMEKVE